MTLIGCLTVCSALNPVVERVERLALGCESLSVFSPALFSSVKPDSNSLWPLIQFAWAGENADRGIQLRIK